jgi:hypothetical protein
LPIDGDRHFRAGNSNAPETKINIQ